MRYLAIPLILLMSASVSGCFRLYMHDIEQGNVVTREMLQQVKPGMTHDQVKSVLGTPLVADVFHADRWDYYYTLQPGGRAITRKQQITLYFDGNRVSRIVPGLQEIPASTDASPSAD